VPTGETRRAAALWLDARHLGDLTVGRRGPRLIHSEGALGRLAGRPLPSVALPVRRRAWSGPAVSALIAGLVADPLMPGPSPGPGGLPAAGDDLPGALVVTAPGAEPPAPARPPAALTDAERAELLAAMAPAMRAADDERGGVPLIVDPDGTWRHPAPGAPSSHLLRGADPALLGGAANEALCARVAAELGLAVTPATTVGRGDAAALLVERDDRRRTPAGTVIRVHRESLSAALGLPPDARGTGPAPLAGAAALLDRWSADPAAAEGLLAALVVVALLGDGRTGLPHLGLRHGPGGRVDLAPLRGLSCTTATAVLGRRAGVGADGVRDLDAVTRADLVAEGNAWGLRAGRAATIVDDILTEAPAALWRAAGAVAAPPALVGHLLGRARSLAHRGAPGADLSASAA
ncbi:MAG: HipA domain-containing protein, partial [Miltoncostaeaceae bacterium]